MTAGGELLRGVMEANAVYSAPAFYCIPLNGDDGTANPTSTVRAFHQLHRELWFLATGIVPCVTGSGGFERISSAEFIRIFDPVNLQDYAKLPLAMQWTLYGDSSLNCPWTLPEYLLFPPSTLIGVEWQGNNFHLTTEFKFLTLVGLEYGMKD